VRISPELHRKAATVASMQKITLNDLVKKAIDAVLSKPELIVNH
jgi:predicted HicB family RNase H-like nuclease